MEHKVPTVGIFSLCFPEPGGSVMSIRPIKRVIKAKPTLEGAGVHLRRAFGFGRAAGVRSVPAA